MPSPLLARALALALLAPAALAAPALSLPDALALLAPHDPQLAALAAQRDAAGHAAATADALPPPRLAVGIDNYPISGPMAGSLTQDGMTMRRLALMQEFPDRAKRQARRDAADAETAASAAQLAAERLARRRELTLAWYALRQRQDELALLDELQAENRVLAQASAAQLAAGSAVAGEALLPRQEAMALADRRDDILRAQQAARASLRRLIGDAADAAPADAPPLAPLNAARLRERLSAHPQLAQAAAAQRRAGAMQAAAQAEGRGDWGLELAYQRRARQFGDMVSLQFSLDLPWLQQGRLQALAAAESSRQAAADAERDAARRSLAARLEDELAGERQLASQLARAREQWLPLARQQLAVADAAWRGGQGMLGAVLAARRNLLEQRLRLIALQQQHAATVSALQLEFGAQNE